MLHDYNKSYTVAVILDQTKKGRKNLTGDFLLGNEIHGTNKQHGHWYP